MLFTGREIAEATGGDLIQGSVDQVFSDVSTDTRGPLDGKLFIPLQGPRFDGHSFLPAAASGGVTGLLVQEGEEDHLKKIGGDITVIRVPDTLAALGQIAGFWRRKFDLPVVAITGSAGKTTTKEMTAQLLAGVRQTLKTEGNFNNLIGLPLTLLRLRPVHEVAILEMGTNVPGEIGRLSGIAAPDLGLITNIGPAHLEGLKSVAMVKEEKGELFRLLSSQGMAVVNVDDEAVRELAARRSGRQITYGLKRTAEVTAEEVVHSARGLSFVLRIGDNRGKVAMTAPGNHNLMNALAAAALGGALGLDPAVIRRGLQNFRPIPGRMEITRLQNGAFLIDDAYNANPVSVREALMTLRNLRGGRRSVVILGDMLELGEGAGAWHEEIGGLLAATGVDRIFLLGQFARQTAKGAEEKGVPPARIAFPATGEEIAAGLAPLLQAGDWLLVKGSRAMKMEEVVKCIIETFGKAPEEA